jgi:hypothetical protein
VATSVRVRRRPAAAAGGRRFQSKGKLAGALISGEITSREAADLSKLIDEYLNSLELIKLE